MKIKVVLESVYEVEHLDYDLQDMEDVRALEDDAKVVTTRLIAFEKMKIS